MRMALYTPSTARYANAFVSRAVVCRTSLPPDAWDIGRFMLSCVVVAVILLPHVRPGLTLGQLCTAVCKVLWQPGWLADCAKALGEEGEQFFSYWSKFAFTTRNQSEAGKL